MFPNPERQNNNRELYLFFGAILIVIVYIVMKGV